MGDLTKLLHDFGPAFVASALVTWKLTIISFTLGFLMGVLITIVRMLPVRPLKTAANAYVEIFRNIPSIALLIIIVSRPPPISIW